MGGTSSAKGEVSTLRPCRAPRTRSCSWPARPLPTRPRYVSPSGVGRPTPDGLTYLGRVGSGLAGQEQERVLGALQGRSVDTSPFADEVPPMDAQGTRWVRPEVVMDVQFLGLSAQGRLRQPAYRGLRTDLSPDDVHDEG